MNTFAKAGLYVFSGALFTSAGIACTYFLVQKKLGLENVSGDSEGSKHVSNPVDSFNETISGWLTFSLRRHFKAGEYFYVMGFEDSFEILKLRREFFSSDPKEFVDVEVTGVDFKELLNLLKMINYELRDSGKNLNKSTEIIHLKGVIEDFKYEFSEIISEKSLKVLREKISKLIEPK